MSIDNVLYKLNQLEHYYNASVLRHTTSVSDVPNVPFTPFSIYKAIDLPGGVQKLLVTNKKKIREQEDENTEDQETLTTSDIETGESEDDLRDAKNIGKIYELKKIYSRLTSIESYLSNDASQEMANIRNFVSQAIELFEVISANFDSYRDKLDEIIIMYYKFILVVYNAVKNYYFSLQKNN